MSSAASIRRRKLKVENPEKYAELLVKEREAAKRYRQEKKKHWEEGSHTQAEIDEYNAQNMKRRQHKRDYYLKSKSQRSRQTRNSAVIANTPNSEQEKKRPKDMSPSEYRKYRNNQKKAQLQALSHQKKTALKRKNRERMRKVREAAKLARMNRTKVRPTERVEPLQQSAHNLDQQILKNKAGKLSISDLTEQLQQQHSEYARKKKSAFFKSVEKGFELASKELINEGVNLSSLDASSESETDSELVNYEDKNIMNHMISNMYKQKKLPDSQNNLLNSTPPTSAQVDTGKGQGWFIDRHKGSSDSQTPVLSSEKRNIQQSLTETSTTERPVKKPKLANDLHKKKSKRKALVYPAVTFAHVGGNSSILQHLEEHCQFLEYPELLPKIKGDLPKCFLIHGPTGCGKTLLANAIAGEYKVPLISMTATELVAGISGDSEANIRDLFEQAAESAPCILLIDDVDAIASKRENATKGMESRLVTQLSNSMDELRSKNLPVLLICATNRPNNLDEAFRRTGRFDIEYVMRFPNRDARKSILEALCKDVQLGPNVSLSEIADLTPGYVGSDLKTLISITNACALHRIICECKRNNKNLKAVHEDSPRLKVVFTPEEIDQFQVKLLKSDFQKAMTEVKPTAKQEDVILVPNTTWDDIGGLDSIRKKLNLCIMERTKRPALYQAIGMTSAAGVLLVGPPGCGKTSVARAVANEAGINFLYIKGAELLNKYVGESEKNVRDLFKKASSLAPCVIFFDEIDSICPRRSSGSEENSTSRVTNQLLLEMSGLEQRTEVYVIAATNRLDRLDKAFLRPGRMDKIIYVGLPTAEGRVEILKALTKNGTRPNLASDVSLDRIGRDKRCEGFSGADLGNLVQVAREACLEEIIESTEASSDLVQPVVNNSHFEVAFQSVRPSVDAESKRNYEAVRKLLENKTSKKDLQNLAADANIDAMDVL
ncbi:nuclear valosin-containing protein [Biomphalaria glabrata]|nr:nuclear valosin-containing protein-like [Biomphalaria glabrata]KAI8788352.1 nuclear valosin-containing protein [Biomphalaria glabrata]